MITVHSSHCCGMNYIHGIAGYQNRSEEAMQAFLSRVGTRNRYAEGSGYRLAGLYVFTGVVETGYSRKLPTYGQQFANFITKHKLGEVTAGAQRLNRNSGNVIQAWIWAPNSKGLKAWAKSRKTTKDT